MDNVRNYVNNFYMSEFKRLLKEREERVLFEREYNWELINKNLTERELLKYPEIKHIYNDFDKKMEGLAIVCYTMKHPDEPPPTSVEETWNRYLSANSHLKILGLEPPI